MPNHVMNKWKISHIPQDKLQYILDKLTVMSGGDRIIDFDLIIPEPRFKKDCPKYALRKPDSCSQKDEARPWYDWYEFNIHSWGTKWNAYDGYTHCGKTYIIMYFQTAWTFAEPVARELAKLGYDLDLSYADEDYGSNCGRIQYCSHSGEWTRWSKDELKPDPVKWARNLWDRG